MSDEPCTDPPDLPPPVRFSGSDGRLEYADGRQVACVYELVQETDGGVWLKCEHDQGGWVFAETAGGSAPCRFCAGLPDGRYVLAEGEFLQTSDLPNEPPLEFGVRVRYI